MVHISHWKLNQTTKERHKTDKRQKHNEERRKKTTLKEHKHARWSQSQILMTMRHLTTPKLHKTTPETHKLNVQNSQRDAEQQQKWKMATKTHKTTLRCPRETKMPFIILCFFFSVCVSILCGGPALRGWGRGGLLHTVCTQGPICLHPCSNRCYTKQIKKPEPLAAPQHQKKAKLKIGNYFIMIDGTQRSGSILLLWHTLCKANKEAAKYSRALLSVEEIPNSQ